ncbi:biotin--[acetyl-CoA-carboxylase] ligase [Thermococcus sp. 2319x1]|uniref:biotin--[acetyl-CoA-carboxylase] ligase n=1 Tax=Thermococcus sp. 2319x1 TaxID=1674923 RepID=UPI001EF0B7E2|nr:biotin--[acetyl-CoA-carboxylase] ligase [Thermococcus sp. 2319x1]
MLTLKIFLLTNSKLFNFPIIAIFMMRAIRDSPVKREILKKLRCREVVSGDEIAREVKTSRVAVWKHIKELNNLGYSIISTPKGYTLISEPRKPYPWELDFESYYFKEIESTMDVAKELAEKGAKNVFVIAEKQTQGRGRIGRKWSSPEGGLYFSLILRPKLPLADIDRVRYPVLEALKEGLEDYGLPVEIAPEGNIFVKGKKIAGILVEAEGELDQVKYVIVGVGVNVNNVAPVNGTSMKEELKREVDMLEFTRNLFTKIYQHLSAEAIF